MSHSYVIKLLILSFFQALYIIKHYLTRPKYVKNTSNITKIHEKTLFSLFLTISDHFKTKIFFFRFFGSQDPISVKIRNPRVG